MLFNWDERKRQINIAKHRLDLLDARSLFDGRPILTLDSTRDDEARCVTIGELGERMVALIWVKRGETIRLISLRSARHAERRKFYNCHGGRN